MVIMRVFGIKLTGRKRSIRFPMRTGSPLGCDDLVLGTGKANKSFGGGCDAYCASARESGGTGFCVNNDNGYSPGNGCCRTPIPRGTTLLWAQLSDLSRKWNRSKLYPCSYAFIEEKVISDQSRFSFPLDYLQDYSKEFGSYDLKASKPSVVRLDWRTGADIINCSQAKLYPTTYACQNNTQCIDFDTIVGGYNCHCSDGYEGNPYLTGGCIEAALGEVNLVAPKLGFGRNNGDSKAYIISSDCEDASLRPV